MSTDTAGDAASAAAPAGVRAPRGRHPRTHVRSLFPPPPPPGRPGDPGVSDPHDALWSVASERLLLLGGPAALLLQMAHPLVLQGVADHSGYRSDPGHRLLGTLHAVLTVAFGDTEQARGAAQDVGRQHARVRGRTPQDLPGYPAGTAYRAGDPHLALWVHATLVHTALDVLARYGGRPVGADLREAYWQQMKPFGRLFGVTDAVVPATHRDFEGYWARAVAGLVVTDTARAVAADVLGTRFSPPLPGTGTLARAVTADLLPPAVADGYGLQRTAQRRAVAAAARTAVRTARPLLPSRLALWPHLAVAERRLTRG
ncbi:oxygenase MpaB family protein [Kineococcus sp. NUM-3379]